MTSCGKGRILIVEDEEIVRSCCVSLFQSEGYFVDTATDGRDALSRLTASKYDLIISDMNMPNLGGMALYQYAEKLYPYLRGRFLLITSSITNEATCNHIFQRLKHRIIKKPFTHRELLGHASLILKLESIRNQDVAHISSRKEERTTWISDCELVLNEATSGVISAEIQNVSQNGLQVRYTENLLDEEYRIEIRIRPIRINRTGIVRWSRRMDSVSLSGIRFTEPLSLKMDI